MAYVSNTRYRTYMGRVKLTLSAEQELVALAKRMAKSRRMSVSALFAHMIRALDRETTADLSDLGPITRQASGLVTQRSHRSDRELSDRELIEEALEEKYLHGASRGA